MLAAVGRGTLGALSEVGRISLFAVEGLSHVLRPPFYWRLFWRAFVEFAYFSLPVVALTEVFTGMVLALQGYNILQRYGSSEAVGLMVALSLLRDETVARLRICPNCSWLFVDRSRNASRLWCDMAVCGNRQKANRYYRRRTAAREVPNA